MSTLSLLARILMAAIFVQAGVHKLVAFKAVSGMLGAKGLPVPDVTTALVILVEIGGGLLLLPRMTARYSALILAVFTLAAGIMFHDFWAHSAAEYTNHLNHFMKNIAIIGGFLYLIAQPPSSPLSAR